MRSPGRESRFAKKGRLFFWGGEGGTGGADNSGSKFRFIATAACLAWLILPQPAVVVAGWAGIGRIGVTPLFAYMCIQFCETVCARVHVFVWSRLGFLLFSPSAV